MQNRPKELILGFCLLIVLVAIGWSVFSWAFRTILGLDKTVASSIIAGLVAVLLAIFAYWREQAKARQEAHRASKIEVYSIFFDIIFDVLKRTKQDGNLDDHFTSEEFQTKFMSLNRGVLLYGSPKVIKALCVWRMAAQPTDDFKLTLKRIGEVLLAMREDIGLNNSGLDSLTIHQIYVNDDLHQLENVRASA
jgi:hypothetical protein